MVVLSNPAGDKWTTTSTGRRSIFCATVDHPKPGAAGVPPLMHCGSGAEDGASDPAALAHALATIEPFNVRLVSGRTPWFWPTKIPKHHRRVIACDSCNMILETDLTMKPRDHERRRFALRSMVRWFAGHASAYWGWRGFHRAELDLRADVCRNR
jgi:hypothetical protein